MMVAESTMVSEHTIRLGSRSVVEEKFKVQGRPRKKRRLEGDVLDEESQSPVKYVRVDPNGEWLAHVVVHQTESMWCNMLEEIKDVVSESEAIDGETPMRVSTTFFMPRIIRPFYVRADVGSSIVNGNL